MTDLIDTYYWAQVSNGSLERCILSLPNLPQVTAIAPFWQADGNRPALPSDLTDAQLAALKGVGLCSLGEGVTDPSTVSYSPEIDSVAISG